MLLLIAFPIERIPILQSQKKKGLFLYFKMYTRLKPRPTAKNYSILQVRPDRNSLWYIICIQFKFAQIFSVGREVWVASCTESAMVSCIEKYSKSL